VRKKKDLATGFKLVLSGGKKKKSEGAATG
jgi:hypothetical protein